MLALQNTAYFVIFLGVLVTVHELGHFLVAKWCGVKVLKFSIGFGPRIVGFTRGETEYRIAWIPLGGYVKMAGEQPDDDVAPEDAKRSFQAQPPWKRGAIVLAGPAFNLIFPVFAYFFLFMRPQEFTAPYVGWVEPELPAARAGIKPGDTIKVIDGKPVRQFGEIREIIADRFDREIAITVERAGQPVDLKITPIETTTNDAIEEVKRGFLGVGAISRAPIVGVTPGSAAEAAGLKTFDRILKVNGVFIADELKLADALKGATSPVELTIGRTELTTAGVSKIVVPDVKTVSVPLVEGQDGYAALGLEAADLYLWNVLPGSAADKAGLQRGDRLVKLDDRTLRTWNSVNLFLSVQKTKPFNLAFRRGNEEKTVQTAMVEVEDENKLKRMQFGGTPRPMYQGGFDALAFGPEEVKVKIQFTPLEAASLSLKAVPEVIRKIALIFGKLFTGAVPLESMGGPIMLFQVASKSAEQGLETFVENMAMVSVNLGLVNLLPIPVLDGFALLAAIWEGIRRRPIPIRAREYANMVGLAMLAILMVMVFKNDITRLVRDLG